MKRSTKIILAVTGLLLVGGISWIVYYMKESAKPVYETFTATRGTVIQEVSVTGKIKPAKKIELEFKNQGQIEQILVKIGDEVKEGQELARLDLKELDIQKRDSEISLSIAKTNYDKLLTGSREEEIAIAKTKVANAQTALEDAQKNLDNVKSDYKQKIDKTYTDGQNTVFSAYYYGDNARNTLNTLFESGHVKSLFNSSNAQAKIDLEGQKSNIDSSFAVSTVSYNALRDSFSTANVVSAEADLVIMLGNLKDGLLYASDVLEGSTASSLLTQTSLDTYKTNISTARLNVITSLTNISTSQNTISQTEITAKSAIDTAQQSLNIAQSAFNLAQNELTLKQAPPTEQDLKLAEANVAKAQAALDLTKEKIRNSIIYAPIKGTITDVKNEVGESVKPGVPVILMINSYSLDIESNIPESDIVKVRIGDLASITLDAFGRDKNWNGRVVMIDPAELEVEGVIYYKTTVVFEGDDPGIKPGMTANVKIKAAAAENVILIPQRALIEKAEGGKTVKILDANENVTEKNIDIGLKGSDGFVEVINGVSEGDRVITSIKTK
jgi:HlyD family secretion protein